MVPPGPLADDLTSAEAKLLDRDAGSDIGRTLGALLELGKPGVGGLVIVTTLCGALTAPGPSGFVQMQIDKDGRLGVLRLSFDDGQAYDFRRE